MLTYLSVETKNNPYRGGIEIESTTSKTSIGNVTSIAINRKRYDKTGWISIYTIPVTTVDDLKFNLFDITVLSGKSYYYKIDVMVGNNILESQILDTVDCWFDGLFVGDFNQQFIAGSNFSVDPVRNTQVAYVTTLNSRTPYRISNANTNYSSGSASGLFLKVTADGKKFIPDDDHSYSTSVLDFLTDGEGKVLKTHDGLGWYVSIDESPSSPYNDGYTGMNSIRFNWTEIGDMPLFGVVVD